MFPKMKATPYIRARYVYPKGNYLPKIGFLEHHYYKNQLNYLYTFNFWILRHKIMRARDKKTHFLSAAAFSFLLFFCCRTLSSSTLQLWMPCFLSKLSIGNALGTHWGRIGDALGTLWGRIWEGLGTHWGRIGDALGTHLGRIGDALERHWGRFGHVLGTHWWGIRDALENWRNWRNWKNCCAYSLVYF